MRIALDVAPILDGASGIGFYVEKIAAALAAAGPAHEFLLVESSWSGAARLENAPLPRARNVSRLSLKAPQRLLLPAEESLGLRWRESRLLARGVDAYHGLGNVIPPFSRLPAAVTVHHIGVEPSAPLWPRFFFDVLPRRSVARAQAVIAVSGHTARELLTRWGVERWKVKVVHEGGPDPIFRPPQEPPPAARPYVLHVGNLTARKNVPTLLRAFARVVERDPARPLRLLLAGRDGDDSAQARRLAARPPLAGRVEFMGPVPAQELSRLYQGAAAVAVPSLLEGFGFTVLEAMACGAPVVAARASSLPEVAGDAALLCDASAPEPLAEALARALDDRELAAELRRKGPARAAAFTWEKAARQTLSILEELGK